MGVSPYFKITPQLATKEVSDVYVKKNFDKLIEYFSNQNQLLDFKFFELVFTAATANYKLAHGFSYIPQDIITTKITGTGTVVYNYGLFDTTYMNITATGPCRVRFFAGTYWNYTTTVNDSPSVYTAQAALPSSATTSSTSNGNVANPMTTLGDIIYGAISGVPARLGIGSAGQILTSNGSVPSWASSSSLSISATPQYNYVSKSLAYSAAINDYILCSGASFTITLPTAVGNSGKMVAVQHAGTSLSQVYQINTVGAGTQTIGGNLSGAVSLYTVGEVFIFISDNVNWQIIQHKTETDPASYSPNFAVGYGNVTGKNFLWYRHGAMMRIYGYALLGTVVNGAVGDISIPSGASISSNYGNNTTAAVGPKVGFINNQQTASFCPLVLARGTSLTSFYCGGLVSQNVPFLATTTVATNMGSNNTQFAIDVEIQISGWLA